MLISFKKTGIDWDSIFSGPGQCACVGGRVRHVGHSQVALLRPGERLRFSATVVYSYDGAQRTGTSSHVGTEPRTA